MVSMICALARVRFCFVLATMLHYCICAHWCLGGDDGCICAVDTCCGFVRIRIGDDVLLGRVEFRTGKLIAAHRD